ncbi:MAG: PmoA family protein [Planctomycetaceae bacterium]|jgi:hypothetical protein|nr:PmoA family protein [Planctomycetaceae bacterium]
MNRRDFLNTTLILASSGIAFDNLFAQDKPISQYIGNGGELPQKHLTVYPDTQNGKHQLYQLWIRDSENTILTSYRAHKTQKYPFFYPVAGPQSGLSLTTESGRPWPHHRSVFFGADSVNGGNYWQDILSKGQIISQGPAFAKDEKGKYKISGTRVEIVDNCVWTKPEQPPILEDKRKFVVRLIDKNRYAIDTEIVLKAVTDKVVFKKTNHGLFGIRCSHDISVPGGGKLISSNGDVGEKDTIGKAAKWMAFFGKRRGTELVEGIAVFCPSKAPHPKFENCKWFTRDYGNCSPFPMNFFNKDENITLVKDEELKLQYSVVAFTGSPEEAELDKLWEEFDKSCSEKIVVG